MDGRTDEDVDELPSSAPPPSSLWYLLLLVAHLMHVGVTKGTYHPSQCHWQAGSWSCKTCADSVGLIGRHCGLHQRALVTLWNVSRPLAMRWVPWEINVAGRPSWWSTPVHKRLAAPPRCSTPAPCVRKPLCEWRTSPQSLPTSSVESSCFASLLRPSQNRSSTAGYQESDRP